jgi:FixJ family two-component response regulator
MVLEIYGYEVEEFATGEELITHGTPDRSFVILDVNLPGANGLKILGELRAMGISVPAVLVSGRATEEMHAQAKRLDALAFFDNRSTLTAYWLRSARPVIEVFRLPSAETGLRRIHCRGCLAR